MQQQIEHFTPELDRIIAVTEPVQELASGYDGPLGPAERTGLVARGR